MTGTYEKPQTDARSLSQDEQEALRIRGVELVLEGQSKAAVAKELGVGRRQVHRWMERYDEGGWEALSKRRRGRSLGSQVVLSAQQQQRLITMIKNNRPDELGIPGSQWTYEAARDLIEREYGWRPARTTAGHYLRLWGFPRTY